MNSPNIQFSKLTFIKPVYNYCKVGVVKAIKDNTETDLYFYWSQTIVDLKASEEGKILDNVSKILQNPGLYKLLIGSDLHYEFNGVKFVKIVDPKMTFMQN